MAGGLTIFHSGNVSSEHAQGETGSVLVQKEPFEMEWTAPTATVIIQKR